MSFVCICTVLYATSCCCRTCAAVHGGTCIYIAKLIFIPLCSFQNHAITPKFAAEKLNTNFISVCAVYTVALEVQRMKRTPTNKESETQLQRIPILRLCKENGPSPSAVGSRRCFGRKETLRWLKPEGSFAHIHFEHADIGRKYMNGPNDLDIN